MARLVVLALLAPVLFGRFDIAGRVLKAFWRFGLDSSIDAQPEESSDGEQSEDLKDESNDAVVFQRSDVSPEVRA